MWFFFASDDERCPCPGRRWSGPRPVFAVQEDLCASSRLDGPLGPRPAQVDRVRARAANMDNRIVSLLVWIFQFSPEKDASLIQH